MHLYIKLKTQEKLKQGAFIRTMKPWWVGPIKRASEQSASALPKLTNNSSRSNKGHQDRARREPEI